MQIVLPAIGILISGSDKLFEFICFIILDFFALSILFIDMSSVGLLSRSVKIRNSLTQKRKVQ